MITFVHSQTVSEEIFECCSQRLMHILQHSYTLGWKEPVMHITKVREKEDDDIYKPILPNYHASYINMKTYQVILLNDLNNSIYGLMYLQII